MTVEQAVPTLVLIAVAAVLAPLIAEVLRNFVAVPEVVIQILLGIILGPYVLALAHPSSVVTAFSDFGLTYLMFLAGTELDLATMRHGHLGRAALAWVVSLLLALAVGALLKGTGLVLDSVTVGMCLTTTALGTLLPILRDNGMLKTSLGPTILAVGAVGEFGPIVAVAVLLTDRDVNLSFIMPLIVFVAVGRHGGRPWPGCRSTPTPVIALMRRDALERPPSASCRSGSRSSWCDPARVPGAQACRASTSCWAPSRRALVLHLFIVAGEDRQVVTRAGDFEAIGTRIYQSEIFFVNRRMTFGLQAGPLASTRCCFWCKCPLRCSS